MESFNNVLVSKARVRFQDCDPFNHLNNAAYINYLINAREDQLIENYNINIYEMGRNEGKSWVVGSNQIAYLHPALLMEEILIESQLLRFTDSTLLVELRMWNTDKTTIKAVMWSRFVHYNLLNQRKEVHNNELVALFNQVLNPVEETIFEQRIQRFKKLKV